MTNHPNRSLRSYWLDRRNGFANQFSVCIATTAAAAEAYSDKGYDHISRAQAASMSAAGYISYPDQDYRSFEIDCGDYNGFAPFSAIVRGTVDIDWRDVGAKNYD